MSDFLEFLNTASVADLEKSTGLSQTLSKKLIKARPFAVIEDLLKVEGVDEEKLTSMKSVFETPAPETPAPQEVQPEEKAPKKNRVWTLVLRWVLILLILAGAGYALVLYGVPFIYNTFLKPVENNTAQLSQVAAQQSSDVQRLEGEIATLQSRVTSLESRADAVDKALAAHDETLTTLTAVQAELKQALSDQDSRQTAVLSYQVDLLRAVNYLSRSRLYLSESNFGLARADALSARNLLSSLLPAAPASQTYALNEAINRLDLALSNLPAYPVVAVYDIDIAWQYLADGLSETAPTLAAPSQASTEATALPIEATPTP